MKITETVTVTKELDVVPCSKCGHDDIIISDNNYSSFNTGGGKCKNCGHEVSSGVGCLPTKSDLVSIWNSGNDFNILIQKQEAIIAQAQTEIKNLKQLKKSHSKKKVVA